MKLYTWIIALYPMLGLYESGVPKITLIEIPAIIIFIAHVLLKQKKLIVLDKNYLFLCLFVLLDSTICAYYVSDEYLVDLIGTTGRYLFLVSQLCVLVPSLVDYIKYRNALKICGIITTAYIMFQLLFSIVVHINLPAGLPFFKPINIKIRTYIDDIEKFNLIYRPRSLFSEPANYSQYTLACLADALYFQEGKPTNYFLCVFYSVGIVCSMSLLGNIVLLFLWIQYFMRISRNAAFLKNILLLSPFIVLIAILVSRLPQIQIIIERICSDGIFGDVRFSVFHENNIFFSRNLIQIVFGVGLIDVGYFMISYLKCFSSFGLIGILFLIAFIVQLYKKSYTREKFVLIIFLVMCFGSELLFGSSMLIWMTLISSHHHYLHNQIYNQTSNHFIIGGKL